MHTRGDGVSVEFSLLRIFFSVTAFNNVTFMLYAQKEEGARIRSFPKMIFEGQKGLPGVAGAGGSVHCGHDALVLMVYGEAGD